MDLEAELREVVLEGERTLPTSGRRSAYKEALMPQYRLLLNVLSRLQPSSLTQFDDYLRVLGAMRDPDAVSDLSPEPRAANELGATDPLRLLALCLDHLPRTTVFAIEPGVDTVTLALIRAGPEPLERRIELTRASAELVKAIMELIASHRGDVERIDRGEPLDEALFVELQRAGKRAWTLLPAGMRAALADAETILYLVSAYGSVSELSIELLWTGDEWLGTTRVIARFPSLQSLITRCSPRRPQYRLKPRALICRTDVDEDMRYAEREISGVTTALEQQGLRVSVPKRPRQTTVEHALDSGARVLHFLGHGGTSVMGEGLLVGTDGELRPADFSRLDGRRTPFVFLNVCELGQLREGAAGGPVGFASRLLEQGAPAVVACLQTVPDRVAAELAIGFHGSTSPVGRALTHARSDLAAAGYPPACWGSYVLFGDPWFSLAARETT